ncbi:polysaccharide pyruvyl transferase family protein [Bacillus sp. EB01]|uniref:polysaccharide pyruvyl transferase family protein n=1 Tax=Bacillus sp. EB01 TaxID=1347086 RepID=UPI0005C45ABB|nr:polysaccharide pyruvyl transferase family protein [Bacillus sp. EB01]
MKKVMITAYLNSNLGDDLFIKILCDRYKDVNFYMHGSPRYKDNFKEIKNLTYISQNKIYSLIDKVSYKVNNFSLIRRITNRLMDAHVYIGGSLFIQNDSWKSKWAKHKHLLLKNKPNFLIGSNFGPWTDQEFYMAYKKAFSHYTDICFRDMKSYNLFKELNHVRYAPDVVFNLDVDTSAMNDKGKVGISLIDLSERDGLKEYKKDYLDTIKKMVDYLVSQGKKVTLFSFCKKEGDETALNEVLRLLDSDARKSVNSYLYNGDLNEAIELLSDMETIVATRFHAMILGIRLKKNVFPIIYSDKMLTVLDDMGFQGEIIKLNELKKFDIEKLNSTINLPDSIDDYMEESKKQFKELDKLLLRE